MAGISFFSFNGKRNPNVIPLQGKKRPAWAPLERTFLEVPHYPGGRLIRTQTKMRKIIVPVSLFYESMEEAEKLKEEIANWLITDQPQELIFDDEKDRTYLAVIDESFDPQQLVNLGEGVLTFICEMPYKLGPTRTVEFQANERGLVANIQNKGSLESNPIIEIEVTKPSTFLDVWNGDNYFRIGWPLRMDQVPVERNQRVMWDEMSTTVGWTNVPNSEDMIGGGAFKVDAGSRLVPVYLGETNIKGWHGCIAKKNIPQGPLQDFIMQAYVGIRSSHPDQMGRVEIGLLDENSDYVARISMNDVHWQAEQNTGFAKLGNKKKPAGERVLINEPGDHPTTWNQ
ncbi:phage tail protein, partial [Bacillus cereus]